MEKPFKKIQIPVPPGSVLDPAQLRAEEIAQEEKKRFEKIADKLAEVLDNEKATVEELPAIVSTLTSKLNNKFNKAGIKQILNL